MVRKYTTTTEDGFSVRLEARLKNAKLVGARELAGLSAKEAAERIGISYYVYLSYESMRAYPSKERQKKICDFYRSLGIFLLEEDVFPEELKELKPKRKYVGEKTVPKVELLSLSTDDFDRKLLPVVEGEAERKVDYDELRAKLSEVLSRLPYRQQQVISMRYGLDGNEEMTLEEIGNILGVSRERVRQIERKVLRVLRESYFVHKNLKPFLKDY